MKITAKSKYAVFAVLMLARNYRKELPLSVHKIVNQYGISGNFLIQILVQLKKAGLVESVRGSFGGYRLTRTPERITVGEILRIMDPHPNRKPEKLLSPDTVLIEKICNEAEDQKIKYLEGISFSALLLRSENEKANDYSI